MKHLAAAIFALFLPLLCCSGAENVPFSWKYTRSSGGKSVFTLTVAPQHYIYADSIIFELKKPDGKSVSPQPEVSPAIKEEYGISQKIYPAGQWSWSTDTPEVIGKVTFQGCSGNGICFMPQEFVFSAPEPEVSGNVPANPAADYQLLRKAEGFMDAEKFLTFLKGGSSGNFFGEAGIIGILLLTLLGGLGLNLTPCILPMVPVTLIIIGAKGGGMPGFKRGCAYGIGMAAAYGLLGVAAALLGIGFGTLNSMPVFNFVIAGIFLFMALCMAGVFNFNFGARFRVSPQKLKGPALLVTMLMGALSALLAGACVAPVVISVLIFVAREYNSGNHWALFLPFLLGIGMALPWPLAGLGLAVLPKPGKFMLAVKYLLAAVVAFMGIYYFAIGFQLLKERQSSGENFSADGFAALKTAAEKSRQNGKPILVKFSASWCKNCHAMEKTTLKEPEVVRVMEENFNVVNFPAENPNAPGIKALLTAWNIPGFPAYVIVKTVQ